MPDNQEFIIFLCLLFGGLAVSVFLFVLSFKSEDQDEKMGYGICGLVLAFLTIFGMSMTFNTSSDDQPAPEPKTQQTTGDQ